MKLDYLAIDGYKGLKKLEINFQKQSSATAIDFLIGKNGSGKSSVLEAIGLIFTRIMQNETPGFAFELKYSMSDGTQIQVRPRTEAGKRGENSSKLAVILQKNGEERVLGRIPNEYLPDRIVSYCSGANNSMEEIFVTSPREALISDLYDETNRQEEADAELVREIMNYYERLDNNPRVLSLDAATSKVILPVVFAVFPFPEQEPLSSIKKYSRFRRMLADRLQMNMAPVAFSFCVQDDLLEQRADLPQIGILRELLTERKQHKKACADYISNGISTERVLPDGSPATISKAVFLYRTKGDIKDSFYHPGLQEFFSGNPFTLISVLLTAYRLGVISELHFVYQDGKKRGLYEMEALSDGELMWIARMGLVLLAQKYCGENTLFLFDEPDVHFNDEWNRDFIGLLYQLSKDTHHEFIIATHSTLILTDALYEQLHLFDNTSAGRTKVSNIEISTFAAQRDEISRQIFKTEAIGVHAEKTVQKMMRETKTEKIIANIEKLGPGYQRFRMYEQLYELLDKEKELR
nr:AAA family ATPase [uncultured Marvinbryantia sp.]